MRIFVTGATGYIGGAVADALLAAGHEVTGLARSDDKARELEKKGVRARRGDLNSPETIAAGAAEADATVHAAMAQDENAGIQDRAAAEAVVRVYEGSGKPFLYTSGVWIMGNTRPGADEDAPLDPPPVVAWRAAVEKLVLDAASRQVRSVVIRPAMVWGRGRGWGMFFVKSVHETGAALMVGEGKNQWTFVHIDDLADLYVRALGAPAGTLLLAAAGEPVEVRKVAEAASRWAGGGGKVHSILVDEAYKTMGPLVQGMVLDQKVSGKRAEEMLGWNPKWGAVEFGRD